MLSEMKRKEIFTVESNEKVQEEKTCDKRNPLDALVALGILGAIDAGIQPLEEGGPRHQAEIHIDTDHVCIPVTRFEELLHAEAELDVLLRAYQALDSYRLEDVMAAVFGPKPGGGEEGAQ